jgi:hypothetical protein
MTAAMALYDNQDPHPQITAVPYDPSHLPGGASLVITGEQLVGLVRLIGLGVLLIGWVAGAYAGIVYWSLHGSLFGVIVSALVPGIAATSTWSAFTTLEKPYRRHR